MRHVLVIGLVLAVSALARADEPVTLTPAEATAPRPAPEVLRAFEAAYLAYDVHTGEATQGKVHQHLSPMAFYAALERPDLVEAYRGAQRTKRALYITGGALAAAGVIAGVAELATRPDLNSLYCSTLDNYNRDCSPSYARHSDLGAGFIAAGVASGAILALVGMRIDPSPVTPVEAKALADAHNRSLWQQLRAAPQGLRVEPAVGPGRGGLLLSGRF